jgi:small subunit ribosomal protein S16
MLAIRLQRVGRKGLPQYRIIVQEAHRAPTSGKVVEYIGSYNPHTKEVKIDKETAEKFLSNGAQPSERIAKIFKSEGVKLPKWVEISDPKERKIRNPEKLRKNQPAEEKTKEAPAEPAAEAEEAKEEVTEEAAPAEEKEEPKEDSSEEKTEDTQSEEEPAKESSEEKSE